MCCSADLESSTQLNYGAVNMPHHIHIDGINGPVAADMWKHAAVCDAVKSVNRALGVVGHNWKQLILLT